MASKIRGYISNNNFYKPNQARKSTLSNSPHPSKISKHKSSAGHSGSPRHKNMTCLSPNRDQNNHHNFRNSGKTLNASKAGTKTGDSYTSILARHVAKNKKKRISNASAYSTQKQGHAHKLSSSPLLKKSFRKTKTPSSGPKQARRRATQNSSTRQKNFSMESSGPKAPTQNFESYFKLSKFAAEILDRIPNLNFLAKTGQQIHKIYEVMRGNKDVYEKIRLYADMAQELEFESMHRIFADTDARKLFSKVFKLERWSIILIFYFKVIKKTSPKLMGMLKGLVEHVWSNQNNLVNWINVLDKRHEVGWKMEVLGGDIYTLHTGDEDSLIVKVVNTCQLIIGYIIKM